MSLSSEPNLINLGLKWSGNVGCGEYYPATVGPAEEWQGKSWRDMPGNDEFIKRCNFVLWRRGLYVEDYGHAANSRKQGWTKKTSKYAEVDWQKSDEQICVEVDAPNVRAVRQARRKFAPETVECRPRGIKKGTVRGKYRKKSVA